MSGRSSPDDSAERSRGPKRFAQDVGMFDDAWVSDAPGPVTVTTTRSGLWDMPYPEPVRGTPYTIRHTKNGPVRVRLPHLKGSQQRLFANKYAVAKPPRRTGPMDRFVSRRPSGGGAQRGESFSPPPQRRLWCLRLWLFAHR